MPEFKRLKNKKRIIQFAEGGSPESQNTISTPTKEKIEKKKKERVSIVIPSEVKAKLIEKMKEAKIYPVSLNSYINLILEEHVKN